MTDENNEQMSNDEIKQKQYELAKWNLDSNLTNIWALAHSQATGAYGKDGAEKIGSHVYEPAIDDETSVKVADENGNEKDIPLTGKSLSETLRKQRQNGEIGTGEISEQKIISTAYQHVENAVSQLYFEDVANYLGMDPGQISQDYQGKQIKDMYMEEPKGQEASGMSVGDFTKIKQYNQNIENVKEAYKSKLLDQRMETAIKGNQEENKKTLESLIGDNSGNQ